MQKLRLVLESVTEKLFQQQTSPLKGWDILQARVEGRQFSEEELNPRAPQALQLEKSDTVAINQRLRELGAQAWGNAYEYGAEHSSHSSACVKQIEPRIAPMTLGGTWGLSVMVPGMASLVLSSVYLRPSF